MTFEDIVLDKFKELKEAITKINVTLFGNGSIGVTESLRDLRKDVDELREDTKKILDILSQVPEAAVGGKKKRFKLSPKVVVMIIFGVLANLGIIITLILGFLKPLAALFGIEIVINP